VKLDSEDAVKLAKMARSSEKTMHEKTQEASELRKAFETNLPKDEESEFGDSKLDKVVLRTELRDFLDIVPEANDYLSEMKEVVDDRPDLAQARDFESIYAHARLRKGAADTQAIVQQAKREALKEAENAGRSAGPSAAPSANAPVSKFATDDEIEAMSNEEYVAAKREGRIPAN
jgi:hypothetical protein